MYSNFQTNKHAGNWAELPTEILVLICSRLGNLLDHVHFRKVCRSWRCAAKSVSCLPCLLLPYQEESTIQTFLPYPYTNILQVDLPETHNKHFYSTSQGWFILLGLEPELLLFNPITRSQYHLPPLTTIDVVQSFNASCVEGEYSVCSDQNIDLVLKRSRHFMHDLFIKKAVLSSSSSNGSDQVLMITVHYSPYKLYLCRPGDKQWSAVRPETLEDVIVDFTYSMGHFFVMDLGGRVATVPYCFGGTSVPPSLPCAVPCLDKEIHFGCSLVGSEDDLFLIRKYSNFDENGCSNEGFIVFNLDTTSSQQPQWSKVESMGNISFYFCGWNWVSSSTGDSPLCKRDHIYYPYVSGLVDYRQTNYLGYDIGVFNFNDKSFVRLTFDWRGEFNALHAAWFKPTLE